jgi:hypothetical protein
MRRCLAITVGTVLKIAAIVKRLEELNFNLRELNVPNLEFFRKVSQGAVVPEVYVNFIGMPAIMRKIASLPVGDQKKITDGKKLKVMLRAGDFVMVSAEEMTNAQSKQVFASDHIRNDSEQAAWLIERDQHAETVTPSDPIMVDRKRNGIVVGELFISARELATFLGRLAEK